MSDGGKVHKIIYKTITVKKMYAYITINILQDTHQHHSFW